MKREQDQVVNLSNCDSEPIRTPGAIQPHGLLFVIARDLKVLQVSNNIEVILGYQPERLLDKSFSNVLLSTDNSLLERHLKSPNLRTLVPLPVSLQSANGAPVAFTCVAHSYPDYFILEFERVVDDHLHSTISIASLLNESIVRCKLLRPWLAQWKLQLLK